MFNLGQRVWWVVEYRTAGKHADVKVCDAVFLTGRHGGDTVAVIDATNKTVILHGKMLFGRSDDATTHALGAGLRLLMNFGYERVEVTDNAGRVTVLPDSLVVSNVKAPV